MPLDDISFFRPNEQAKNKFTFWAYWYWSENIYGFNTRMSYSTHRKFSDYGHRIWTGKLPYGPEYKKKSKNK